AAFKKGRTEMANRTEQEKGTNAYKLRVGELSKMFLTEREVIDKGVRDVLPIAVGALTGLQATGIYMIPRKEIDGRPCFAVGPSDEHGHLIEPPEGGTLVVKFFRHSGEDCACTQLSNKVNPTLAVSRADALAANLWVRDRLSFETEDGDEFFQAEDIPGDL